MMEALFLIYSEHYTIQAGDRFSSTIDLNKGKNNTGGKPNLGQRR
jgi:hypothetical protein